MPAIKIMLLGGGSLYFRNVLGQLALEEELAGSDVVLYDLDGEKAERMASLGRRLSEEAGSRLRFTGTGNPDEATAVRATVSPKATAERFWSHVMLCSLRASMM